MCRYNYVSNIDLRKTDSQTIYSIFFNLITIVAIAGGPAIFLVVILNIHHLYRTLSSEDTNQSEINVYDLPPPCNWRAGRITLLKEEEHASPLQSVLGENRQAYAELIGSPNEPDLEHHLPCRAPTNDYGSHHVWLCTQAEASINVETKEHKLKSSYNMSIEQLNNFYWEHCTYPYICFHCKIIWYAQFPSNVVYI